MPIFALAEAFSPIFLCALIILILRRSAVVGALSGIGLAFALIYFRNKFSIDSHGARMVVDTTLILTFSAALVIIPGLYLNAVLRAQGIVDALAEWIQSIHMNAELKALILLLGVLPAVESLTGFGVSLFVGIPIFYRLFISDLAFRLSLLGMNIIPWGALALPTIVGASLSGYSVTQLGTETALTSALVFPLIGVMAIYVVGKQALLMKYGVLALVLGSSLSALLYFFNMLGFVETAGILAGVTISLLGYIFFHQLASRASADGTRGDEQTSVRAIMHIFSPYLLVLSLFFLTHVITPIYKWLAELVVLVVGRVRFSVFASPGLVLCMATLIILLVHPVTLDHKKILTRAKTALSGLCCFIFMGQLMNESHMIDIVTETLKQWKDQGTVVLLFSSLLGMVSGFITGSNLGGNALVMGMQQQIGNASGDGLLFSALQNSAAGHAVFTSLPIIILAMTIVRDTVGENKGSASLAEYDMLRFGLKAAGLIYVALVLSFMLAQYIAAIS
jgi:lactate permease